MSGFGKHPEKSSAAATKVETTGSVKLLPTAAGGTMVEEKKTKTESGGGPMVQVPLPFGFQVQVKVGNYFFGQFLYY
jgi:hypothetical protein